MTFDLKSDRLFLVSERNTMKNEMRVEIMYGLENHAPKSTFKCWNCDETHPVEVKKDWGSSEVCPKCDLYLFDEAEKRDKRRDW